MKKVTFPGMWTNTCCSHPRHTPEELDSTSENGYMGLRRAAVRRSRLELGITDLNEETDLKVGSRILYYANNCDRFGEHELEYIIFSKTDGPGKLVFLMAIICHQKHFLDRLAMCLQIEPVCF